MKHSPEGDLQHFLKLAAAQLRHRIKERETQDRAGAMTVSEPMTINRMRLLEELIKEQIPHENSDSAARKTR